MCYQLTLGASKSIPIHPARTIPYRILRDGLDEAKSRRYVTENVGDDGLSLYCYTKSCVYDAGWNEFTLIARGLVLDHTREAVVATPFPKFFNAFEHNQSIPDLPFETFEKLDGCLVILFCWDKWRATTKGVFGTEQAKQASKLITDVSRLDKSLTYLLEYVGPENRIVIEYKQPKLYLLSAYDAFGKELFYEELVEIAKQQKWEVAGRRSFLSMMDLFEHAKELPATQEGHVVRFDNGVRVKIKGDAYCRIHALISEVTPLGIWNILRCRDEIAVIRQQIPEELWTDFDQIRCLLTERYDRRFAEIRDAADSLAGLTDKEIGLRFNQIPERVRRFIFPYRHANGDPHSAKLRDAILRDIRPDANALPGYTPSYAFNRMTGT